MDRRIGIALPLRLAGQEDPWDVEMTTTENLSPRGARVTTWRRREPGERVLLTLRGAETPARARVVYCQPLAGGLFGVGFLLDEPPRGWPGTPPGTSP